jgi:hypothetical protein
MILMAKLAGRQSRKHFVVLRIGGRDDGRFGPGVFEEHPLECGETRRIEMFNHLDHRGGFEAFQPPVAIHQ